MKKILSGLLILVLVIAVVAWYFVSFRLDSVIEQVIEESGSAALGTSVQVGKITTSIKEGSLKVSSLTVANPPGYESEYAISFDGIEAAVDYDGFIIDRIIIDKPSVTIEEKGGASNFGDMLAGMEGDDETPEPEAEDSEQPTITIRHFRMNETDAAFLSEAFETDSKLHVDAIELNDIQGTPGEVASIIAREIAGEVSAVAAAEIIKAEARKRLGIDQDGEGEKESVGDKIKGLFERDKDDDSDG